MVNLPLDEHSLDIVRRSKAELTKILLSKYNCNITIYDVPSEGGAASSQSSWLRVTPEKRFEVTLESGVVVSVWKADLTNFCADAVVNAANEKLMHIGGLARALCEAGGPQIQRDSTNHVRTNGIVATGSAIMMDPGSLPCKKIVHAVGPRLNRFHTRTELFEGERLLYQTVRSVIATVEKNRLRTVAIPAISSGLFNFPMPQCAETIVKALTCARHLKEIFLVNNDDPTVQEMERACRRQFIKPQQTRDPPTRSKANSKPGTGSGHFGNVCVTVKRGCIEDEQTDVIVNATSRNLPTASQISKAILQKAGSQMSKEMQNAARDDFVAVTGAHKLKCKQVYHILLDDDYQMKQTLKVAVSHCLDMASNKSHKSISFPAIGTGNLGLKKRDVAQLMAKAVAEFATRWPNRLDVYFVIHQSQEDTFKVFEEEMSRAPQMAPRENLLHGQGRLDEPSRGRVSSPHISLTCPSAEAQHEAQRWLTHLLSRPVEDVTICSNFILHLAEKEQIELRNIATRGVSIKETFDQGQASIRVHGNWAADVAVAALQVEAMLCNCVDQFVGEEEHRLSVTAGELGFRTAMSPSDPEFLDAVEALKETGLQTAKVERVRNYAMGQSFDHLRSQPAGSVSRKMFQCVPAHFCDVVCRVGFNVDVAPPDDPEYGEGIYFAGTVKKALSVWRLPKQEYVYIVEAEVLTGRSAPGRRGLVVPPVMDRDPSRRYDSVSGGNDISVIFNSRQALPTKIITCKMRRLER